MQKQYATSQRVIEPKAKPIRKNVVEAFRSSASALYNHMRIKDIPSHRNKVNSARRALTILRSIEGEHVGARCFTYLRKVDPSVFEEMVLTALQDGGRFIKRNLAYSNDGGQDGSFQLPGVGWMMVQSKRYGAHISAAHVREFQDVIRDNRAAGGLFIHTGRTGAASWAPARSENSNLYIVSGDKLLDLLRYGILKL